VYLKTIVLGVVLFVVGHSNVVFSEEASQKQIEIEEPTGAVTLQQALALALTKNPELAIFSWKIHAQEAATLQAGLLPNPTIGADLQDIGADGSVESVPQLQANLTINQPIELGGKRSKRREVASLNRDLSGWDYETKRIDVVTHVSSAFTDLLSAQQSLVLTEEMVRLAEQVAGVVSERVKAGKVSPVEETKANVALSFARIEIMRAVLALEAARKQLAATWGSTTPLFTKAGGELGPVSEIPSFSELTKRLSQNPDIARWTTEISQHQAVVDMERSKAVPDITLMGGVRRYDTTNDNVFMVGLSIPLPLFNQNHGGIDEARYRLAGGKEEQRAAQVRVATALAWAYLALEIAHTEVTALKTDLLPGAKSAFEAVNEGYRLGKFGLLDVLDAQRTLFGSQAQYLRALTDYHHAVANVERLIGEPLNAVWNTSEEKLKGEMK